MKKFFKDYAEYQTSINALCNAWYKKHWKGTVVFNLVLGVIALGVIFRNEIKEKIEHEMKTSKKIREMESQ